MDIKKINWDVVGDNIIVKCVHCDRNLAHKKENITTYSYGKSGFNFCDGCCVNMLLINTPLHIPYEQKLKYKLFKFLGKGD